MGGLIYHRIGGVPRPGDRVELPDQSLTLTVEVTDGRRVAKVLAVRTVVHEPGAATEAGGESAKGSAR